MLNRPDPMVNRALDVFRQINQAALGAGEGIQRIRRLFQQELPTRTRCQLPELIAELRPVLDILALRTKSTVSVDVPGPVPDLLIDRLRIQHVLFALAQNAVDASAQVSDTPSIRIDVSADRYTVETGVTDSGTGVPTHAREQLFRPFFTTKPKPRNRGLGLATAYVIVNQHGGSVAVTSDVGVGTTVEFMIPVAPANEPEQRH